MALGITALAKALTQQYAAKALTLGISGNAFLQTLRAAGLGYRTQDFYNIWRQCREAFNTGNQIKALSETALIPKSMVVEGDFPTPVKYWYKGIGTFQDKDTGAFFDQPFFILDNPRFSKSDLDEEFIQINERELYVEGAKPVSFTLTEVVHKKGYSY